MVVDGEGGTIEVPIADGAGSGADIFYKESTLYILLLSHYSIRKSHQTKEFSKPVRIVEVARFRLSWLNFSTAC